MSGHKLLCLAVVAVLVTLALGGCGGSDSTTPLSEWGGTYKAETGGASMTLANVSGNTLQASVIVGDDAYGGSGQIGSDGSFTISCSQKAKAALNITGQFEKDGSNTTLTGSISGAADGDFVGEKVADGTDNAFGGRSYSGAYYGDDSGSFSLQISDAGVVTGECSAGDVTGNLSAVGGAQVTAHGSAASGTASWSGTFYFVGDSVLCRGTWTSQFDGETLTGTWNGGSS